MSIATLIRTGLELRRLRSREYWTRLELEAYQARALDRLRAFVYANSPFYQRFHNGLVNRPLAELPILTKPIMMDNFDELVTDRSLQLKHVESFLAGMSATERFRDKYVVTSTSGTTGRRGIFLSDPGEWAAYMAPFARSQVWAGMSPSPTRPRRTAHVVSTVPWSVSARAAASFNTALGLSTALGHGLRLDPLEPLESIVQRLNEWQPQVLTCYASMAGILAGEQLEGRLHIAPDLITTVAEVLTPDQRARIARAWGRQPYNLYGSTESAIAAECERHSGLHVFEDVMIPEVVDEDGAPVLPGNYGDRLVITALFRRTQPLIRYEISDMVRMSPEHCSCGRVFGLIDGIQGRVEEVLVFDGLNGGQVRIDPIFFEPLLGPIRALAWQVVQE
ncbi:MAG TPA: phenylacetate--CoA ligase family protein, partial [Blastocatellia bacterium]|nr:phenylacetate--CoA ligase family protein [Blastocatellia bacterium]